MDSVALGDPVLIEDETTDEETRLVDFVSLQLRLRQGLSRSEFQQFRSLDRGGTWR